MLLLLQKMLYHKLEVINLSHYNKKGYLTQDFRIFRLKDAALQEISFHYHDFHKIILLVSGEAAYIIEGKTYPLKPGIFSSSVPEKYTGLSPTQTRTMTHSHVSFP